MFIDAKTATTGTYSANSTTVVVTIAGGHNVQVGQKVALDYTSYSSGSLPADEIITVTSVTTTTFTGTTAASISGPITGNVSAYLPLDFCFYLVNTGVVTNVAQYLPLFVASIPSTFDNQFFSLTLNGVLPLINHPVVQAGANVTSANSSISPKMRGLMLQRGQALYVKAASIDLVPWLSTLVGLIPHRRKTSTVLISVNLLKVIHSRVFRITQKKRRSSSFYQAIQSC
jgi:hypothetical protein